jgi:hypothetical protein
MGFAIFRLCPPTTRQEGEIPMEISKNKIEIIEKKIVPLRFEI